MTSGELSPWAPGPPGPTPSPYAGSYDGPWVPTPGAVPPGAVPVGPVPPVAVPPGAPAPWFAAPSWSAGGPVSDDQLRALPPPVVATPGRADQRPAVIGLAVSLAVTAALLWVCGLSLALLVAVAGTRAISPVGDDGVVFHLLDEFVLRMGDGLWLPLYGFPLASVVTGFLLLVRRPWARVAHTAVAAGALAWAGWWLRDSLLPWFVVAFYVGTAVAVLWAPAVGRWYAARTRAVRPAGYELAG